MEAISNCELTSTSNKKKVGRKIKYATDEERKKAKQQQTYKSLCKYYEVQEG